MKAKANEPEPLVSCENLESGQKDYAFVKRRNASCGWNFYLYKRSQQLTALFPEFW